MKTAFIPIAMAILILWEGICGAAENGRTQYPPWLINSYIGFNAGYVDYPFSKVQLEPGYQATSIGIPHAAVSMALGHHFNKNFSAQLTYTRPILWVNYRDINGFTSRHTVRMNVAGLTARAKLPIGGPFSIYAEGGLGIVTRSGLELSDRDAIKSANYLTILLGAGFQYRLNKNWDLQTGITYTPPNERLRQPRTFLVLSGIVFNLQPLSAEKVQDNARSEAIFPKNLIQIGYATNKFGTGVNRFVAGGKIKIFWGGNSEVARGTIVRYQRNVFHTKRMFSFDLGASVANWQSVKNRNNFYTISVFPQFRFTPIRLKPVDIYLSYSLAGPTYITKTVIDGHDTGKHFTFQDFMGLGWYFGKQRRINMEISIGHYSNGNIFTKNAGVKIPLTFTAGYTF